ncbi:uncharacterized protein V6R79_016373 [Siganus canaliculatus]
MPSSCGNNTAYGNGMVTVTQGDVHPYCGGVVLDTTCEHFTRSRVLDMHNDAADPVVLTAPVILWSRRLPPLVKKKKTVIAHWLYTAQRCALSTDNRQMLHAATLYHEHHPAHD